MNAPEERAALTPASTPTASPTSVPSAPALSLYAYALRLHRAEPGGRLPEGGYALPAPPGRRSRRTRAPWKAACAALTEALAPLMAVPGTAWTGADTDRAAHRIHLRLADLSVREGHVQFVVAELPLEDEGWARALGRCLTRTGTGVMAVCVGLALLTRLGEPEDVPYLRTLGQLKDLAGHAVRALDAIDRPTAALVWLGHYASGPELRALVDALAAVDDLSVGDDPSARSRLDAVLRKAGAVRPETARRVAEAVRLADLLREDDARDAGLVAGAGRLLRRMSSVNDDRAEILACPVAVGLFEAFVVRAAELPPTLDHYATLLSVALELHSGPSRLLEWETGRREALLDGLESVLSRSACRALPDGEPAEDSGSGSGADSDSDSDSGFGSGFGSGAGSGSDGQGRVEWARSTALRLFGRDAERAASAGRLRIEATVLDPVDPYVVETRILIDGLPLVPAAFGRGPAHSPEYLLDSGRLRATGEPREVQLAEAYCTEGCCGALHVTIRRDGDHVVWSDWRRPAPPLSLLPARELPEYRFEAAAYDAEIARAENDHSWTWPARRAARLIAAGVRDRPDLLTRWDAEPYWIGTDFRNRDIVAVSLRCRARPAAGENGRDGKNGENGGDGEVGEEVPWQYVMWHIPADGTAAEDLAAAALRRLATSDPRTYGGGGGSW
ncbi:hypothetical protein OHA04_18755 [Streptomyces sp. NBC_01590]|uniref:hypothetical protein n=1 Tax=Streptomyces sp. NBC_01590 TaxID=2975887 RepID=UPI00386C3C98